MVWLGLEGGLVCRLGVYIQCQVFNFLKQSVQLDMVSATIEALIGIQITFISHIVGGLLSTPKRQKI